MKSKVAIYRIWRIIFFYSLFGRCKLFFHFLERIIHRAIINNFGKEYQYNSELWKRQILCIYQTDTVPLSWYADEYGMAYCSLSEINFTQSKGFIFIAHHGVYTIQKIAGLLGRIRSQNIQTINILMFRREESKAAELLWQDYLLSLGFRLHIVHNNGIEFAKLSVDICKSGGIVVVFPDYFYSLSGYNSHDKYVMSEKVIELFFRVSKKSQAKVGIINTLCETNLEDASSVLQWCDQSRQSIVDNYYRILKTYKKGWFFRFNDAIED